MKIMKKISIMAIILLIAVLVLPVKSEADFDTGTIMNGADSFINRAENRELFNAERRYGLWVVMVKVRPALLTVFRMCRNRATCLSGNRFVSGSSITKEEYSLLLTAY